MPKQTLLSLVMIVKNEAASIQKIIESVRGQIDTYMIVDTGSTDDTIRIAKETLDSFGVDGEIAQHPFVDFATTRNLSIDLAERQGATFGLLLSGDETLVDLSSSLRSFCEEHRGKSGQEHDVYKIRLEYGGLAYDSARLIRLSSGWRYVGPVHEVLMKDGLPPPSIRVPGCTIIHEATDPERKNLRLYKDLELLREQIRKTPDNARVQFYIAQTLEELGFTEQAHVAYARRVSMEGWKEERYEAAFRMARTAIFTGHPWHEVQNMFLEAYAIDPRRAEPLYQIAQHWKFAENYQLCWFFSQQGASMPYPDDCSLFVLPEVYRWQLADLASISGYYIGEFEKGEVFAKKALEAFPDNPRLRENVLRYERRKKA